MTNGLTVEGLRAKIATVEEMIQAGEDNHKDMSGERAFIKSWKTYLPGGRNHHKLAQDAPE